MTKLDEARTKLLRMGHLPENPWGKPRLPMPELEDFIEALIDAKLSPAPVGEDGRIRAMLGDPRDSVSVGPEGAVYHRHLGPVPAPVEATFAEEMRRDVDNLHRRFAYHTKVASKMLTMEEAMAVSAEVAVAPTPPAEGSDGGAKTGEELHAEHRRIIADLEARLAEAEVRAGNLSAGLEWWRRKQIDTERDLIAAHERIDALLTAPASPETPEGQADA